MLQPAQEGLFPVTRGESQELSFDTGSSYWPIRMNQVDQSAGPRMLGINSEAVGHGEADMATLEKKAEGSVAVY